MLECENLCWNVKIKVWPGEKEHACREGEGINDTHSRRHLDNTESLFKLVVKRGHAILISHIAKQSVARVSHHQTRWIFSKKKTKLGQRKVSLFGGKHSSSRNKTGKLFKK